MSESRIQSEILLRLGSRGDVLLWRNSVGVAVPLSGDAPQRFGQVGSPDLLGSVTVRGVAIALGVEVKSATGKERPEQTRWRLAHLARGWIVFVARSADDAHTQLEQHMALARARMGGE
jgi:hypothetical protein